MTPTGMIASALAKQVGRLAVDVALLPVTVPLTVLDVVQPWSDDHEGWPALIVLPDWLPL